MTSNPVLQRQASLPRAIRLLRHNPARPAFAFDKFDPHRVRTAADLPPYLLLGPLDAASFAATPDGWSASYRGSEPDTHLQLSLSLRRDPGFWRLQQSWCGVDGGLSQAVARLPLGRVVSQFLYGRFPSGWDRAAKERFERDYQLHYVPQSDNLVSFCGVPDGAFRTIAFPVAVDRLRHVKAWLEGLVADAQFTYPLGAEARLVFQAVNYREGKAPEWTRAAPVAFEQSIRDTGTVPFGLPVRETAPDGSAAWTLRRCLYVVLLTVPFGGLRAVLDKLAGPSGPVRSSTDEALPAELVPLVFPLGFEAQAKEINVWDPARTTRTCWQFADPHGRPGASDTDASRIAQRGAEACLQEAERISDAVTSAARQLLAEAFAQAGGEAARGPASRQQAADYIFYRDHIGWVITTSADYELLRSIYQALPAATWGQFLNALPDQERDRLLSDHAHLFGPDLFDDRAEPPDPEDDLYSRDTPFDPEQLPGFSDGDYPPWPAEVSQVSDDVCREAYRRFGKRASGFIHTCSHIRDDQLDAAQAWLASQGHTVERRGDPGA